MKRNQSKTEKISLAMMVFTVVFSVCSFYLIYFIFHEKKNPEVLGNDISIGLQVYAMRISVTDVSASNITSTSADIRWKTAGNPSLCTISFGETAGYELGSYTETSAAVNHLVNIGSLDPETTYFYKIDCVTPDGEGHGEAAGFSFTTLEAGYAIAITGIKVNDEKKSSTSGEVKWKTSVSATCSLDYGKTLAYEIGTLVESGPVANHRLNLTGLSAGTKYYFRLRCESADGGYGESAGHEFTTEKKKSNDGGGGGGGGGGVAAADETADVSEDIVDDKTESRNYFLKNEETPQSLVEEEGEGEGTPVGSKTKAKTGYFAVLFYGLLLLLAILAILFLWLIWKRSKKKVLVMEDDPKLRKALSDYLADKGYTVVATSNNAEGMEMAKKEKPDLIFMDTIHPKKDGFKTAEELKKDEKTGKIPILSPDDAENLDDIKNALTPESKNYFVKSDYSHEDVAEKIKDILESNKKTEAKTGKENEEE